MIKTLQLQNFRSYEKATIVFDQFNVLLGKMGAGKTSQLHALALLMAGEDPLVNGKSEGLAREVRLGQDEFHIAAAFSDGLIIEKRAGRKHVVSVNGEAGDVKVLKGTILARLGVSTVDIVLALLDPTRVFSRDQKFQRELILRLMSTAKVEAPPMVKQLGLAESFTSPAAINTLIANLKDVRIRDLNREIKNLNAQIPAPVEYDAKQRQALEARLREINKRRDTILAQQVRDEEWGRVAEVLAKRLAALPVPDASVSVASLEADEKRENDKLAEMRGAREKVRQRSEACQAQNNSLQQELHRLADVKKTLERPGKACPTCQREMKPADKKHLIDKLQAQIEGEETMVTAAQKDVDKAAAELKEIDQKGLEQKKHAEAVSVNRQAVASQLAAYAQAKKAVDDHEALKPKDANWPAELSSVAGDIAAANLDLLDLQKKEDAASQREIQVASVRSKESEAERLDSAAKELATLKDKILSESSGGFIESMKKFIDRFGLGEVKFSLDPFGFSVGGVYADQLSGGQKVIIEAALRQAAAKASGLNIMALDDANMVTPDVRQKLSAALIGSEVQTIVCSMVQECPVVKEALPKGVKMYWLEAASILGPTIVKQL